ncbi:MAG: cytochrome P460 family protein [Myxococcales bacterium]|nr:cytochrome P460 family protein [Myxococcales bacterium]
MRAAATMMALALLLGGCKGETETETKPDPGPEPAFPEDYAASYVEVRDCRQSGDHDLNIIRILADPAALGPYRDRTAPFPEGAVVLKEEFEFDDVTCEGPIKQWTVMVRLADGAATDQLDWRWQRVTPTREVAAEDEARCSACHSGCTPAAGGYEWTCAVP